VSQVEWETMRWVDWYHTTRLYSAVGDKTPNDTEAAFHASLNAVEKAALSLNQKLSGKPWAILARSSPAMIYTASVIAFERV